MKMQSKATWDETSSKGSRDDLKLGWSQTSASIFSNGLAKQKMEPLLNKFGKGKHHLDQVSFSLLNAILNHSSWFYHSNVQVLSFKCPSLKPNIFRCPLKKHLLLQHPNFFVAGFPRHARNDQHQLLELRVLAGDGVPAHQALRAEARHPVAMDHPCASWTAEQPKKTTYHCLVGYIDINVAINFWWSSPILNDLLMVSFEWTIGEDSEHANSSVLSLFLKLLLEKAAQLRWGIQHWRL